MKLYIHIAPRGGRDDRNKGLLLKADAGTPTEETAFLGKGIDQENY